MRFGLALTAAALLLAGSASSSARSATQVRVTMTFQACRAAPISVAPGATSFIVANRTRRARLFTIAGRKTRYIRPHGFGSLRVGLARAGVYRFFCISQGRPRLARTGVIAVRPKPAPPPPPPEHRIGVRQVSGSGEFYDRQTNASFVPRGSNYLRRSDQEVRDGQVVFHGSTFIAGKYGAARVEAALEHMHNDGYNATRVILDVICVRGCLGDFGTSGLSSAYLDNVADFLRRAKENGIYVMLANEGNVPAGTRWESTVNRSCCETFAGTNLYYLTEGGIEGTQQFWRAFLKGLVVRAAPLDIIFGYSMANEAYFEADKPPLSLVSGTVHTANGHAYDLASPAQRQLMMDENLVNFAYHVRNAIREVDPTALVGMGFFWPQSPNPARQGDPRLIRTGPVISSSTLDFVDLHLHPKLELTFQQYVENFEVPRETAKPIVMGEYGLSKLAEPDADRAASELVNWQRQSCLYGFDGWLLWTWDTTEEAPGEPDLWTAVDTGGTIERALAPSHRSDPCGA
jgi:hypothetical protein